MSSRAGLRACNTIRWDSRAILRRNHVERSAIDLGFLVGNLFDLRKVRVHGREHVQGKRPAVVGTGKAAGRRGPGALRGGGAVEKDVVLLAWVPLQVEHRRCGKRHARAQPRVLGGKEELILLDAQAGEGLIGSSRRTSSRLLGPLPRM